MLKEKIHVAVPTAFDREEKLNIDKTIGHMKELYSKGVKSVLVAGTTGEQHSLNVDEKMDILDAIESEKQLISEMEIIMGVSAVRQKDAETLASRIGQSTISAIMLGYPPYIIPTQQEAINYSEKIMRLSNKPTILYNNPKRTGFDLSSESIVHLGTNRFVIGIKDPGDKGKLEKIKKGIPNKAFYFYAGGETDLEDKISWGYNRLSSIAGNTYPSEVKNWFLNLLDKEVLNGHEEKTIESIKTQIFSGNAILNTKNILAEKYNETWTCRSPIGN